MRRWHALAPGSAADRKSTRLNSSHTEIYTLSLHDARPISSSHSSKASGPLRSRVSRLPGRKDASLARPSARFSGSPHEPFVVEPAGFSSGPAILLLPVRSSVDYRTVLALALRFLRSDSLVGAHPAHKEAELPPPSRRY